MLTCAGKCSYGQRSLKAMMRISRVRAVGGLFSLAYQMRVGQDVKPRRRSSNLKQLLRQLLRRLLLLLLLLRRCRLRISILFRCPKATSMATSRTTGLNIRNENQRVTRMKCILFLDTDASLRHSASNGHVSAWSFTWIPPRFTSALSGNGRFHPPSLSGVASHRRNRWRRGAGGR